MTAITLRAPVGFPGAITRDLDLTVVQEIISSATPPTAFGQFVKLVSGLLLPLASGDAAAVIYGLLVRPYPMQGNSTTGSNAPPTTGIADVLRRGYMAVTLKLGTATKGGQVYVVTTAGGSVAVNDIVTASSPAGGGTAVAAPGCFFQGAADSGGIVEVTANIAGSFSY
jgi:hypothetical protein